MLKLRKILLCDFIYYGILFLSIIVLVIRLSLPKESTYSEKSKTFIGTVEDIRIKEKKLTLTIKNTERVIATYYLKEETPHIELGDKVKVEGTFIKPSPNTTEYLFNYQEYCLRKNIFYLVKIDKIEVLELNSNFYYYIKQKSINHLKNPYLKTFLLGDKSMLNDKVKKSYQENGISHLFAISGMHITLLVKIIEKILSKFKISNKSIFSITTILLLIYLSIIGPAPSITRGILFYFFFSLNKIYYFYIKPINLFLFILSICLFINPYYLYNVGFLYSFFISFTLLTCSKELEGKNYFHSLFKVSVYAFLVSIPITTYFFSSINVLGIIYNLFFVPFVSIILFPMSLLTALISQLEPFYNILISILETITLFLSKMTIGKLVFKRLPRPFYFVEMFSILLFVILKNKKLLYLFLILVMIHVALPFFNKEEYFQSIDVGQGDSTLFHYHRTNILIDTGGFEAAIVKKDGMIYYHTLEPLLRSKGINKIDTLILTHGDADHMGESIDLVNNLKVKEVIFNCGPYNDLEKKLIKVLRKRKIKYRKCINELTISNHTFYFLNTKIYDNENDNSNIIYTELNGYKFMFMGDASVTTEKEIMNIYNLADIDVLKVGHHGSKTSSSKKFINEINPKYSIISVGNNNRYGHPNKEVLDNLNDSKIYRTDEDGSIMFKIKNNELKIETCSP